MSEVLFLGVHLVVVTLSREPGQSLLVYVYSERVDAGDPHIYPQVELEPVNDQRVVYVLADNQGRVLLQTRVDGVDLVGHHDSFALRPVVRFYYEDPLVLPKLLIVYATTV